MWLAQLLDRGTGSMMARGAHGGLQPAASAVHWDWGLGELGLQSPWRRGMLDAGVDACLQLLQPLILPTNSSPLIPVHAMGEAVEAGDAALQSLVAGYTRSSPPPPPKLLTGHLMPACE